MFKFKKFTVYQDRCAMKVGTDGVLLGAWASGGRCVADCGSFTGRQRILDIGTGTGLVALMMAQRFANAEITAIDIDAEACRQAEENIKNSPFYRHIMIKHASIQEFADETDSFFAEASDETGIIHSRYFDAIVCNPPFFENSLECPEGARTAARHTSSLPFAVLFAKAYALLSDDGVFSIVIPTEMLRRINEEASLAGFFVEKRLDIKTVERKQPKRTLLAFCKKRPLDVLYECQVLMINGIRSPWYSDITKDFYL